MAKGKRGEGATIVLKKVEEGGHGHHGGAWKVAYADFVTAMMAFFLLMWLLNATTEEQRRGLADYFNPTNVLASGKSGSGQPFGGRTPNEAGEMSSNGGTPQLRLGHRPIAYDLEEEDNDEPAEPMTRRRLEAERDTASAADLGPAPVTGGSQGGETVDLARASDEAVRQEAERRETEALERLAESLRAAVRDDPALAELARQFQVEQVPEGLRIQVLDADRQPMFALGGSQPHERIKALMAKVAAMLNRVPNAVSITGHTDATPFRAGGRSNWDLSADRANATRRLLTEAGVAEARLRGVTGMAEREPLIPAEPGNAANRRVSILLLRDSRAGGSAP